MTRTRPMTTTRKRRATSSGRTSTFFQDSGYVQPTPREQRSATLLVIGCGIALGSGSAVLVALAPVLQRWFG